MEKSLQNFIAEEEQRGDGNVLRVTEEVPIEYVTTEMVFELERRREYPLLYFENVEGFDFPLVTNVFATRERIGRAVGIEGSGQAFIEEWNSRFKNRVPVNEVSAGAVQENVIRGSDVDVNKQLPAPKHFEADAGRYISAGVVIAKHPETGVQNMANARIQLKGPQKVGVSVHSKGDMWEYIQAAEERGETLDTAVMIGAHPSVYVGASPTPSIDVDEMEVIGAIRDEPLDVVDGETVDLAVPAAAEVIMEGTIDPTDLEDEGPFGEYSGFMSGRSTRNLIRVDAITHRDDAVFQSIAAGNSAEHVLLAGMPKEPEIYEEIKNETPVVTNVSMPVAGTILQAFVSIDKTSEGEPVQAALSAMSAWRHVKEVVVVDDDINIDDEREVLWALATRMQPDEDIFTVPKSTRTSLDPSATSEGLTAKIAIDATMPLDSEEYLKCTAPEDAKQEVKDILTGYGDE
jgi:UbiD family decarboxylase